MLSANSFVTGAPPTMIFTLSRMPASSAALTTSPMTGMVVVSRAERPMISAFSSYIDTQVDDFKSLALKHHDNKVLSDIVQVALNGPHNDLALSG